MSTKQGFELHPEAAQDIQCIWDFIAERNVRAARRVREEVLSAIQELTTSPHQGHRRPDLTSRPLRFRTVRDYLIAYAPDEHPCWWSSCCMVAVFPGLWQPSSEAGSSLPGLVIGEGFTD